MFLLSFISRSFPFLPTLDLSLSFSSANFERITVNQLDTSEADVARSRMNLVSVSYLCIGAFDPSVGIMCQNVSRGVFKGWGSIFPGKNNVYLIYICYTKSFNKIGNVLRINV